MKWEYLQKWVKQDFFILKDIILQYVSLFNQLVFKGTFRTLKNIYDKVFLQKIVLVENFLSKTAASSIFDRVFNAPLAFSTIKFRSNIH